MEDPDGALAARLNGDTFVQSLGTTGGYGATSFQGATRANPTAELTRLAHRRGGLIAESASAGGSTRPATSAATTHRAYERSTPSKLGQSAVPKNGLTYQAPLGGSASRSFASWATQKHAVQPASRYMAAVSSDHHPARKQPTPPDFFEQVGEKIDEAVSKLVIAPSAHQLEKQFVRDFPSNLASNRPGLAFQRSHFEPRVVQSHLNETQAILQRLVNEGKVSPQIAKERMQVVARALSAYGTDYAWDGGHDPHRVGPSLAAPERPGPGYVPFNLYRGSVGFDCSGLVRYAFHGVDPALGGPPLPTTGQINETVKIPQGQLQPGDLIFYGTHNDHVAIFLGHGKIIDAPQTFVESPKLTGPRDFVRIERLDFPGKGPNPLPGTAKSYIYRVARPTQWETPKVRAPYVDAPAKPAPVTTKAKKHATQPSRAPSSSSSSSSTSPSSNTNAGGPGDAPAGGPYKAVPVPVEIGSTGVYRLPGTNLKIT